MRKRFSIFIFLATVIAQPPPSSIPSSVTPIPTAPATAFPTQLSFIPACAHACIQEWLPGLLSNTQGACEKWEGSGNPGVEGSSAKKVWKQIDGCVWEFCTRAEYRDEEFRVALGKVCHQKDLSKSSTGTRSTSRTVSSRTRGDGTSTATGTSSKVTESKSTQAIATDTPSKAAKDEPAVTSATLEAGLQQQETASHVALPPGTIAGIVIGVVAFVIFICILAAFLYRRLNGRHQSRETSLEAPRPPTSSSAWQHISSSSQLPPDLGGVGGVGVMTGVESQRMMTGRESLRGASSGGGNGGGNGVGGFGGAAGFDFALSEPEYRSSIYPASEQLWCPVSPISPTLSRRRSVSSVISAMSMEDVSPGLAITGPDQSGIVRGSAIARADSVSWRRDIEEAAERASLRVGLKVSSPILEGDAVTAAAARRASGGRGFVKRWSRDD